MKTKTQKGIILFALGILMAGLNIHFALGPDYGYSFDVSEGIKKGGITYILTYLTGEKLNIYLNPIGYILIILGISMTRRKGIYIRNIRVAAVVGLLSNLAKILLPFMFDQYHLVNKIIVCIILEILAMLVILYSFTLECKKQVDNYMYMEVGKDLTFATELYGFGVVFSYVMLPFRALYIYFARGAYVVIVAAYCVAILYYVWKTLKYTKQLSLFAEN